MLRFKSGIAALCAAALLLTSGCGTAAPASVASAAPVDAGSPVSITVWNYYNGDQLDAFNSMVDEFNETVGKEKGIEVSSYSQGGVSELETNVLAAAEGKVGADPMPNIFSGYADTTYALDQMGMVVDLSDYLTEEERSAYIDGYLEEGDFSGTGSIKIFPTAKSTELLFLNKTDWEPFAEATGATYDDLQTIEGVVETAEKYYQWADSLTPEEGDGKAFFGRDAMANYMLIGARQLGSTIFDVQDGKMTLHFDKEVIKTLWDNYYVPFIKGYFSASGKFRSDEVKTGNIIAYVGSSSSSSFFPSEVITSDTESHPIEREVLPAPRFRDGENYAVQQGAGMVVTKADEKEVQASVEFLKWFTAPEHNIAFSIGSGYLPVTKAGSKLETIKENTPDLSSSIEQALDTVNNCTLYTPTAFSNGTDARAVLEYALSDAATADRGTVEERMAQGQDFETAAEEFLSADRFERWYQDIQTELQQYAG